MEGLRIRDARPRDTGAIEALTLGAYQQYAAAMPAHWAAYRRNIRATLASVEVAEKGKRLVGAVLLYPAATSGLSRRLRTAPEVRLLAVAPAARGQGIGAALMRECVARARRSGATALTLHTNDVMQAAIRLYERLGFQRAAELDFRPAPDLTIKGYSLDLEGTTSKRRFSMSPKQKAAARPSIKKGAKAARRGRKSR
jgi:ribosomal protein S18 acetylase RimI-like enzyme